MNMFELRSQFRSAAVIACAKHEVQKLFERRSVRWSAAQNRFEQTDGFLGQAVAGEEIDVGQRLGDKLLRLLVKLRPVGGRGSRFCDHLRGRLVQTGA